MTGQLFLVGVPIGNMGDITKRAVETLSRVAVIAAEDTRKAKKLLTALGISAPQLIAHGAHNEHHSRAGVIKLLAAGQDVAYISDAGMPGISDPGYLLSKAVLDAGYQVHTIPGVTAAITAVAASALPCERFTFIGFLPRKSAARQQELQQLRSRPETLIFYEAPHRVLEMLSDINTICGDRHCSVARELTKTHEEIVRGTVSACLIALQERPEILGEFTVVIAGAAADQGVSDVTVFRLEIQRQIAAGVADKDIRDQFAPRYLGPKKDIYQLIQTLKGKL